MKNQNKTTIATTITTTKTTIINPSYVKDYFRLNQLDPNQHQQLNNNKKNNNK